MCLLLASLVVCMPNCIYLHEDLFVEEEETKRIHSLIKYKHIYECTTYSSLLILYIVEQTTCFYIFFNFSWKVNKFFTFVATTKKRRVIHLFYEPFLIILLYKVVLLFECYFKLNYDHKSFHTD